MTMHQDVKHALVAGLSGVLLLIPAAAGAQSYGYSTGYIPVSYGYQQPNYVIYQPVTVNPYQYQSGIGMGGQSFPNYATGYYPSYGYGSYDSYSSYGYDWYGYGYDSYGYGGYGVNPNTPHYYTGDRDALNNELCYWADYGRSPCDFNPHQWVYDPYTGTWY